MDLSEFKRLLTQQFPFQTTSGQQLLLDKLSSFVFNTNGRSLFVLKGYAGTGKTTSVGALVKTLPVIKARTILLAPTGRAAKVLSNYAAKQAFTIHKKIYRKATSADGSEKFVLQPNLHTNTFFIVDEASMISNASSDFRGSSNLLDDLFDYVYSGENCRLIFVGDTAQLPPVGLTISPALDEAYLIKNYSLNIDSIELTDVVRQNSESGILFNATKVREIIRIQQEQFPQLSTGNFTDIVRITGGELEDALNQAYSNYGPEETMVICRSNKRANIYNQQIRSRIRWQEDDIAAGDYLMVVKNNYFWLPEQSKAGFIANGDIIEIAKITKRYEQYNLRFADIRARLVDYPDEPEIETRILLDTIMSESPALSSIQSNQLYTAINEEYLHITNKRNRYELIKKDPFFNALQVKFAYAVTCHKAQGGQWKNVFVEQGYLTPEMFKLDFLRWLYTGITRATEKLYLINFNKEFFEA